MLHDAAAARKILDLALKLSAADACVAFLRGHEAGQVRFVSGGIATAGSTSGIGLTIRSSIGRRIASFTTSQIDAGSIEFAVRASEGLARLVPEDPRALRPLGAQSYLAVEAWDDGTAGADPGKRAAMAGAFVDAASASRLAASGFCETGGYFEAAASTAGLSAYHRRTLCTLAGRAVVRPGGGSGWAGGVATRLGDINAAALGRIAAAKARDSASPAPLPPGRYTVVLEPSAVADLLAFLAPALDGRRAEEGGSPFSGRSGSSRLGEIVASPEITLRSDPSQATAPAVPFDEEGTARGRIPWIEKGVLRNLWTTRDWAGANGRVHVPAPANLLMDSGTATVESMVRATERGLLVTRLGSVRLVDPRVLRLTGVTQDGLFLIEGGAIAGSVRNLRLDESLTGLLGRTDTLGVARRAGGWNGPGDLVLEMPALRAHDVTFSAAIEPW